MKKLKEVRPTPVGKVGWETEAWFELERAADSTDKSCSRAAVYRNLGESKVIRGSDPANDEPGWEVQVKIDGRTVVDIRQLSKADAHAEFERWVK